MSTHAAKTYLGKEGLDKTFQWEFPEEVSCVHCVDHPAYIAFVMMEEGGASVGRSEEQMKADPRYVTDLRLSMGTKGLWPHDCCAIAVYLCPKCLKATAEFNQA